MTFKTLFPRAMEVAYLDSAAEGLPAPGCTEAFLRYCRDKEQGTPGRRFLHQAEAEALEMVAQLLKTEKSNVAFVSSASEALYILASSLEWNPGDEVIISDIEFPSNIIPWLSLKNRGVRVIVVPAENGAIRWDTVAGYISSRTRLVSLSLVSYKTGAYLTGVPTLSSEVKRVGAYLCIDATQALGRCPVSLDGVDYLMASSFKWLMGPHGLGLVYLSPELREHLRPTSLGWYSVVNAFAPDRFERYSLKGGAACLSAGMPNFPSLYALRESLSFLLGLKVEAIYEELRPLVERLRSGFEHLGCDMLTPSDLGKASGIVAFRHSQSEAIGLALEREGIVVWGGDGRVRTSVHLYNDLEDIDRCLTAFASILSGPQIAAPQSDRHEAPG
jgi:cysteine desulfurase/selenocysteine lyase